MHKALELLRQARVELEKATPDKGGHRIKAMQTIDTAIAHVKAGIEYDRKYDKDKKK